MTIKQWFANSGLSYRQLSDAVGIPLTSLYLYVDTGRKPRSRNTARKLCDFTNGKVTMAELYGVEI